MDINELLNSAFKPDGYSPQQAVKKFADFVTTSWKSPLTGFGFETVRNPEDSRYHHRGSRVSVGWETDLRRPVVSVGEIIYPQNFDPKGLIFNGISVHSLNRDTHTNHSDLEIPDIYDGKKVTIPAAVQKDFDKIKKFYVDYGFVEKPEDVGFVIAKTGKKDMYNGLCNNALIYVSLPAKKISFERADMLAKQFKNYDSIEKLLHKLDDNIKEENGTLEYKQPESPKSPMFVRLLLDKEHYEMFSQFKNAEHYVVNVSEMTGDYPPCGYKRWQYSTVDSIGSMIDGELKFTKSKFKMEAAENDDEKKYLEDGFKNLLGLKDNTSIAEVILDGRQLHLLKEDLLAREAEKEMENLFKNNPSRLIELMNIYNAQIEKKNNRKP